MKNNKINKLIAFALVAISSTIAVVSPVSAQATRVPQDGLNQLRQARCERVKERVDFRIRRYEDNKDRYIERYQKISESVSNALIKLDGKGYDLNALKADLETLKSKRIEFVDLHTKAMSSLRSARDIACENRDDRTAFEAKVKDAQDYLAKTRTKAKEIHEFIRTEIREDLQNLRDQARNNNN